MFDEIMQVNANYLVQCIKPLIGIILFSIIYRAIFPLTDMKFDESIINCIKLIGYGFLAVYIYVRVSTSDVAQIDVLTFFTFLLAAFEATHNFMLTIGAYIGAGLRILYASLFGKRI